MIAKFRIASILGLALLLIALATPWLSMVVSLTIPGMFSYGPYQAFQLIESSFAGASSSPIPSQIAASFYMMMAAFVIYIASMALAAAAVVWRRFALVAGALALAAGGLWIGGAEYLNSTLMNELASQGIPVGGIVTEGYGLYLVAIAGTALVAAAFLEGARPLAAKAQAGSGQ